MLKHLSYEKGQTPDEFHLLEKEIFYNAVDGILYFGGKHHATHKFEGGGGSSSHFTIKGSLPHADIMALGISASGDTYITTDSGTGWHKGDGFISAGGTGPSNWQNIGTLVGPKGNDGQQGLRGLLGKQGESGYGYVGAIVKADGHLWITPVNEQGTNLTPIDVGEVKGVQGIQGIQGVQGDNAFIAWTQIPGNENKLLVDFLASLKGVTGADGQGYGHIHINAAGELLVTPVNPTAPEINLGVITGKQGERGEQGISLEFEHAFDTLPHLFAQQGDKDNIGVNGQHPQLGEIHNPTPPHHIDGASWHDVGHIQGPTGPQGPTGATRIQAGAATIGDLPTTGNTEFDLRHVEDACKDYVWDGIAWKDAGAMVGPKGDGIYMKGTKTIAEINAMLTLGKQQGYLYIMSETGTLNDHHLAVDMGDGLKWSGGQWINVGELRGPQGPLQPFATQVEVDTGSEGAKAVSPLTLHGKLGADTNAMKARMAGVGFDFYGTNAPHGSLGCTGQEVSKTTYALLYAAIGDVWATTGGASAPSSSNFRLPNLSGRYARGGDNSNDVGRFLAESNKQHLHTTEAHHHTTVAHHHKGPRHRHSMDRHHHGANHNHSASSNETGNHRHTSANGAYVWTQASAHAGIAGGTSGGRARDTGYSGNHRHTITVNTKTMNTSDGGPTVTGYEGEGYTQNASPNTNDSSPNTRNEGGEARPNSVTVLKCVWTGL